MHLVSIVSLLLPLLGFVDVGTARTLARIPRQYQHSFQHHSPEGQTNLDEYFVSKFRPGAVVAKHHDPWIERFATESPEGGTIDDVDIDNKHQWPASVDDRHDGSSKGIFLRVKRAISNAYTMPSFKNKHVLVVDRIFLNRMTANMAIVEHVNNNVADMYSQDPDRTTPPRTITLITFTNERYANTFLKKMYESIPPDNDNHIFDVLPEHRATIVELTPVKYDEYIYKVDQFYHVAELSVGKFGGRRLNHLEFSTPRGPCSMTYTRRRRRKKRDVRTTGCRLPMALTMKRDFLRKRPSPLKRVFGHLFPNPFGRRSRPMLSKPVNSHAAAANAFGKTDQARHADGVPLAEEEDHVAPESQEDGVPLESQGVGETELDGDGTEEQAAEDDAQD